MTTPSTQNATKSVRVSEAVHARLQRIVDTTSVSTVGEAVAFLLDPNTLRIPLSPEQRVRWTECAKHNGMPVTEFVKARVEGAMFYGADPGALRNIHDMVLALVKAQNIVPRQLSTPGSHHQVIAEPRHP